MKHPPKRPKTGITRECSRCGGDLGDHYMKHRYCKSCKAEYERQWRAKASDAKFRRIYNKAINDVLVMFPKGSQYRKKISTLIKP